MASDVEAEDREEQEEKPFAVERAKTGRAKCKKCKQTIEKGEIRMAKYVTSFFADGKLMPAWHHVTCLFEVFAKQRATTRRIDDPERDVKGWDLLADEDRQLILERLQELDSCLTKAPKKTATPQKVPVESSRKTTTKRDSDGRSRKSATNEKEMDEGSDKKKGKGEGRVEKEKVPFKDDFFREFQRVCNNVANVDAYTDKTAIIKRMFTRGAQGDGFKGDVVLWCKLLLPGAVKRVYNLQSKQLIKLFARLLLHDEDAMLEHLERGDVADTISTFFESSVTVSPCGKSTLTLREVDFFLEELSRLTKEEEQVQHFRSILDKCTSNDLKMIVRLIKHDLRINAGPKHILEGVHEDAYEAFQMSRDLEAVVRRFLPNLMDQPCASGLPPSRDKVTLALMTPVLPMLAEACTSVEMAVRKCPNGMLSEVKYDGERVQVHKSGGEFCYFSRSLKPVMPHKVNLFKDYIVRAFPDGDDLILDSEVLMVDNETGRPLPFGTLGIHKKTEFKNANVCLFVFDCLYYNGEILMNKPMSERRRILKNRMAEIPNRIMLSEVHEVHDPLDLKKMIVKVLKQGLEGLVLKDLNSRYEPGKRHWLKVKKDYLCGGAMADSADLVVLGAWYGTGNKGGMLSIFLMGCYDKERDGWLTVTKVHTGHDDATLAALQNELDMVKIGKDVDKLPSWLHANKPMVPDFVARDPKKQPVWEITGAEFTNHGVHTADGISIRFPRVTRIRRDKDWSTATTLNELRELFRKRPESIDFSLLLGMSDVADESDGKPSNLLNTSVSSEPSTSYMNRAAEIKEEPPNTTEELSKGRKRNRTADGTKSSTKRSRVTKRDIKDESEDEQKKEKFSLTRAKKVKVEPNLLAVKKEEKREDPCVDRLVEEMDTEEFFERETNTFDVEDSGSGVLRNVRAYLASDFDKSEKRDAQRMLRTLGAAMTTRSSNRFNMTTHVIHARAEIPSTVLEDFVDLPKTVKHVNVSWLEETLAMSRRQDERSHAVKLAGDYCDCPCTHR